MSKINIPFNGTDYSIDESALTSAKDSLKTHLSTVMNGSGGGIEPITLDGVSYSVDPTKLSTATNGFVAHLGTLSGEGGGLEPIIWDGNTDGKTVVSVGNMLFVKMSDQVFSVDDFVDYTVTMSDGHVFNTKDTVFELSGAVVIGEMCVISVSDTDALYEATEMINLPETGTYFVYSTANDMHTVSLNFAGGGSAGGDTKLTVNGAEYLVDSTKLSDAIADLHEALGRLSE